jgi:acetylornithine deacetylase/succinyl-diaminopimelate desuccinylase-like protein
MHACIKIQKLLQKRFSTIDGLQAELMPFPERLERDELFVRFQQELDGELEYLDEYVAESPNLILRFGRSKGKALAFNTHSDTVINSTPVTEENGMVYGPGACDAKGQIVALYLALREMSMRGLRNPNIVVQVVTQEEKGGNGTLALIRQHLAGDFCIVLEPNQAPIKGRLSYLFHHGGRGALWHKITIHGISTHQGNYYKGISAVAVLRYFLEEAQNYANGLMEKEMGNKWFDAKRNIQYCDSQVTTSEKHFSKLPEKTECYFSIGFVEPGKMPQIKQDLKRLFATAKERYAAGRIAFYEKFFKDDPEKEALVKQMAEWRDDPKTASVTFPELQNDAYLLDENDPFVRYMQTGFAALQQRTNLPISSSLSTWLASCDAQKLVVNGGVPTVVTGAGELQYAHSSREHINIDQILGLAAIVFHLAKNWNGKS